jgi:hypothetical protein
MPPGMLEVSNMKTWKRLGWVLIILLISAIPATGADFDGTKPIICASIKIFECTEKPGCQEVTAQEISLSQLVRINVADKKIIGNVNGAERVTVIEYVEHIDGKLMLYGAEEGDESLRDGVAWNATIDEATGSMVFSATGDGVAFVIFGACIPQ